VTRAIAIVGSSVAINEPWSRGFGASDLLGGRGFEPADQNFALTDSGRLWQVVALRTWAEQDALALEASRIVRPAAKTRAAIEVLRSWREGDQTEQRSTLEFLRTALDGNRLPGTKLFERG
jgi:hypothetical protein